MRPAPGGASTTPAPSSGAGSRPGRGLVATAAGNSSDGGSDGRLRGLDDELRTLSEAEAAADAALRTLESDRRIAFERALQVGERALEEGLTLPELPDDIAERFASAKTADDVLALMDNNDWEVLQQTAASAADDSRFKSLEFSLEEIEEELLQKARPDRASSSSNMPPKNLLALSRVLLLASTCRSVVYSRC